MKTLGRFFFAAVVAGGTVFLFDEFVLYPSPDLANLVWPSPAYFAVKSLGLMAPRLRIVLTNLMIGIVIAALTYLFVRALPMLKVKTGVRAGLVFAFAYAVYVFFSFDVFTVGMTAIAFTTACYESLRLICAAGLAGFVLSRI